ncbi:MAG: S8 family serine peptidase [Prevotella sp.]|nr:S8 family serine peptidase [Prevotella sp.]
MRKQLVMTLMLVCLSLTATAQKRQRVAYPGGKTFFLRVELADKKGSAYSLKHPEKFLSAKSLERRRRQGLAVDSTDLPLAQRYVDAIRETGVKVVGQSKWNNTVLVSTPQPETSAQIEALPFVRKVTQVLTSPDSIVRSVRVDCAKGPVQRDKPDDNYYGPAQQQIETLGGVRLHEAGFRGKGITIAILDGGFMNCDSIPLFANTHIVGTKNFAYPQAENVCTELDHGTMVLSCMGTNEPNIFVGTAPDADYWLVRTESGYFEQMCEEDFWAMGAEFADSIGADMINSSLGYYNYDGGVNSHIYRELDGHTALISRTASMLAKKGIILVNSAGNSGNDSWKKIGFPADAENILAAGALRPTLINAGFSSLGPSADNRVKPDVMAIGNPSAVINGRGSVTKASGTSFASPITCGMVASLWSALPELTAMEIMDLVRCSADRYDYPDNVFGYGIPDYWKAYQMATFH